MNNLRLGWWLGVVVLLACVPLRVEADTTVCQLRVHNATGGPLGNNGNPANGDPIAVQAVVPAPAGAIADIRQLHVVAKDPASGTEYLTQVSTVTSYGDGTPRTVWVAFQPALLPVGFTVFDLVQKSGPPPPGNRPNLPAAMNQLLNTPGQLTITMKDGFGNLYTADLDPNTRQLRKIGEVLAEVIYWVPLRPVNPSATNVYQNPLSVRAYLKTMAETHYTTGWLLVMNSGVFASEKPVGATMFFQDMNICVNGAIPVIGYASYTAVGPVTQTGTQYCRGIPEAIPGKLHAIVDMGSPVLWLSLAIPPYDQTAKQVLENPLYAAPISGSGPWTWKDIGFGAAEVPIPSLPTIVPHATAVQKLQANRTAFVNCRDDDTNQNTTPTCWQTKLGQYYMLFDPYPGTTSGAGFAYNDRGVPEFLLTGFTPTLHTSIQEATFAAMRNPGHFRRPDGEIWMYQSQSVPNNDPDQSDSVGLSNPVDTFNFQPQWNNMAGNTYGRKPPLAPTPTHLANAAGKEAWYVTKLLAFKHIDDQHAGRFLVRLADLGHATDDALFVDLLREAAQFSRATYNELTTSMSPNMSQPGQTKATGIWGHWVRTGSTNPNTGITPNSPNKKPNNMLFGSARDEAWGIYGAANAYALSKNQAERDDFKRWLALWLQILRDGQAKNFGDEEGIFHQTSHKSSPTWTPWDLYYGSTVWQEAYLARTVESTKQSVFDGSTLLDVAMRAKMTALQEALARSWVSPMGMSSPNWATPRGLVATAFGPASPGGAQPDNLFTTFVAGGTGPFGGHYYSDPFMQAYLSTGNLTFRDKALLILGVNPSNIAGTVGAIYNNMFGNNSSADNFDWNALTLWWLISNYP